MPSVFRLSQLSRGAPFYANALLIQEHWGALRRSDYFEILAITSGEGWQAVSSPGSPVRRERLAAGQMFFFRPQDVHEFAAGPSGMSLVYVAFSLSSWRLFSALAGIGETRFTSGPMPRVSFDPADDAVIAPFRDAVDTIRRGADEFDLIRFWTAIVPLFVAAMGTRGASAPPGWLRRSVDAMGDEPHLRHGVRRLRELAHVSAAHLSRATRRHFGVTPTGLVTDLRLRHAAHLLSTTQEGIARIAGRCGFATAAYFSTRFREAYAMSPTEYRRHASGEPVRPPQYGTIEVGGTPPVTSASTA